MRWSWASAERITVLELRRQDRRGHTRGDPHQPARRRGVPRQVRQRRRSMTTVDLNRLDRRGDRPRADADGRRHPRLLRQHRRGEGHLPRPCTPARSSRSSAATARASPPPCGRSPACCKPQARRDPLRGRASHRAEGARGRRARHLRSARRAGASSRGMTVDENLDLGAFLRNDKAEHRRRPGARASTVPAA